MQAFSLRTKILFSVGLIIFIVLGTSTMIHIQDVTGDYLEALTWRSEALAQDIINEMTRMQDLGLQQIEDMFPPLALRCIKLYEFNREKNLTHFAVIDAFGVIGPHNDTDLWNTPVSSPLLLEYLQQQKHATVLAGDVYHTLVPVFNNNGDHLATIDIGTSKRVIDDKVQQLLSQSIMLFIVFLFLAFVTISFLMHVLLTKPVRQLVSLGQQLADGHLVHVPHASGRGDEVAILFSAFTRISDYVRNLAEIATSISIGDLRQPISVRSEHDVLGQAFQRMNAYLNRLSSAASAIAGGDLSQEISPESKHDVLGNAFRSMAIQLRGNFEKIQMEVAERTRAQEALQKLNEELEHRVEERTAELAREKYILETFMNTVPDSIYFKDLDGRITNANTAHAAGYGFTSPESEIGKTDFDLLPEELARMTREQDQNIINSGEPLLDRELPIPQPDGSVQWSLVTKMPLRDEHGHIIGTFGISRDITSQKQTSISLEQAYAEILSLNRQLQEDSLRYYIKALLIGAPAAAASSAGIRSTVSTAWNAPYCCVVLIKILSRTHDVQQTPLRDIMQHVMSTYENYHQQGNFSGLFSPLSDTEATLILNVDDETHIHDLCAFLVVQSERLLQQHDAIVILGIGGTVNSTDDLHHSYDSAQHAIFTRTNTPTNQILTIRDAEQHKKDALLHDFPVEKEQNLITAVIGGQKKLVQEMLEDILTQNRLEQSSYQKLMTLYTHFLQTAGKILAQAPVQETGSGESSLLQTFRAA